MYCILVSARLFMTLKAHHLILPIQPVCSFFSEWVLRSVAKQNSECLAATLATFYRPIVNLVRVTDSSSLSYICLSPPVELNNTGGILGGAGGTILVLYHVACLSLSYATICYRRPILAHVQGRFSAAWLTPIINTINCTTRIWKAR